MMKLNSLSIAFLCLLDKLRTIRTRRSIDSMSDRPIHILLSKVDHFEPFNGGVDYRRAQARVTAWVAGYAAMASRHRDADGRMPQHTWFYPPHHDERFLSNLLPLCRNKLGEIELHLHHNRMPPFPDTRDTLRTKIISCIDRYAAYGIFCIPGGERRFAFIHGDWALDNSRGPEFCGINDEISLLKECGCYADFTFPSLGTAQPAMINRFYYCKDDPTRPKSYNKGREMTVNGTPWGDLLMIPGILGIRWKSRSHRIMPSIEASNISRSDPLTPARLDYLINNSVTICGRPDWRFIKLHTHSAREDAWDAVWGESADSAFTYLESNYNDGQRYKLHYVTAREMYNIAKAAEAGMIGDPDQYRDFKIPPYLYQ